MLRSASVVSVAQRARFDVRSYGARGDGVTSDLAAFHAALVAASAAPGGVVHVPAGTWELGAGLSLNGYNAGLVGESCVGTVLQASDATGYVLESATAWTRINSPLGNFTIRGCGVADAAQGGLRIVGASGIRVFDVRVLDTGGPGLYVSNLSLAHFQNVTVHRPVGASDNDVPYVHLYGWVNGCRFDGIGLHGENTGSDGTAVVLIENSETFVAHSTAWTNPWGQSLFTPEDGAVFDVQSNGCTYDAVQTFDSGSATEGVGTDNCRFRFRVPTLNDYGGNELRGTIPGRGTKTNELAAGVIVEQDNNRIAGVRGYRNNNVRIAAGVTRTYVDLGGSFQWVDVGPAVVDNSTNATNTVMDASSGGLDGVTLRSPNGSRYRVAVADDGTLSATAL